MFNTQLTRAAAGIVIKCAIPFRPVAPAAFGSLPTLDLGNFPTTISSGNEPDDYGQTPSRPDTTQKTVGEIVPKITSQKSTYEVADDGLHNAVAIKLVDAGLQPGFPDPVTGDTTPKKQVALLLELDQKDRNGKPLLVNKYMTSSFSSLATLTKVLRAILGRGLTAAEIDNGIDGDMVHGKPCAVMIVLKETAKGNWASVETVLPHVKSMPVLTPYMKVNDPLPIWLQRKIDQQIVIEPEVPSAEDEQVLA